MEHSSQSSQPTTPTPTEQDSKMSEPLSITDDGERPLTITESIEEYVNDNLKRQLLEQLKTQLAKHEINMDTRTALECLRYSMEVVELSELKGIAQKEMAVELIKALLNETPMDESKKIIIQSLLDEDIFGDTIDIIVDATQGNVNVNQVQEVAKSCCFPFFKSLLNK